MPKAGIYLPSEMKITIPEMCHYVQNIHFYLIILHVLYMQSILCFVHFYFSLIDII